MKRLFPNMGKFAEMSWRAKLKDGPGVRALFGQVAFDNLVVTPVFYFPFFYCFKQSIQGDLDLSKMDFVGIGRDAYEKYCANIFEDCIAMWTLFVSYVCMFAPIALNTRSNQACARLICIYTQLYIHIYIYSSGAWSIYINSDPKKFVSSFL